MGFGYDESCGTNNHNEYTHVASSDPSGDKELVYETLEVIAESALQRLDRFKAQGKRLCLVPSCSELLVSTYISNKPILCQCIELNNLVWAFARLGHKSERSEKLFSGVAEQLVKRTWHFKPQDIGTTLWSFATAEFYNQDAFRAGAARLNFRQIRSFKVRFVSKEIDMYLSCIHVVLLSNILSTYNLHSHRKCQIQSGPWQQLGSPRNILEPSIQHWYLPHNAPRKR